MIPRVSSIRHSLVSKVIFSVGITFLVSISVWAYFNIRFQKKKSMQHIIKNTARLCNTIKLGTHYAMMHNSRDDINQIINNIAKQKELETIRIYNKAGQIKFSNRAGEVDRFTNIKAEACDVCHKTDPPISRLELEKRMRLIQQNGDRRYLGIITSIRNEPDCASGACHVHDPNQTVLGAIDVVFSLAEYDKEIVQFERGIIALTVFVFLLTAGVISFLMRRLLRMPIRKLIHETMEISKGRYNTTFSIRSNDEMGQLAAAVNRMARDIAAHQAQLKRQKDEYRNLFELVPCEITIQDRNFRLLRYNERFARKFNPKMGDFCYHAYKGLEQKCENCPVEKTFKDGKPHYGEESGVNKNGKTAHFILVTAPVRSDTGDIMAAMEMSFDITDTRLLQNKLVRSEQNYYNIFNNIPNPVFVLDAETLEILDCNHSVESVYGFPRTELRHRTFMVLFMEADRKIHADRLKSQAEITQVKQKHKSGKPIIVNIRISPTDAEGQKELLVTTSDITKRLEAEQQLIQAGKMATLGEMATGIAHELNQPLSVIKTASNFMIRKINKNEPVPEEILKTLCTEIDGHVNRATRIIKHMREFGRKSNRKREPVDINEIIRRAFDIFNQQLQLREIEVVFELTKDLPPVWGEPDRLEQVFINLLMNARDAIEEKRRPRVETDPAGEEKQDKRIYLRSKRNNDTVVVEVEDTGVGIDASLAGKIFEPFFTTKEVGKGTGIGLSISYGIIKDCNGTITAMPDKTSGACFVVIFPAVLEAESPEKKNNRETGEPAYP